MDATEIIIPSEVSHKEKKTNTIWYHLYVESKIWHNELIYETETDSQAQKKSYGCRREKVGQG